MDGTTAPARSVTLKRHRFTATDVRRMIEAGVLEDRFRIELIGGDLIEMPTEGRAHWGLKTALVNWVLRRLPETINLAPDGPLRLSEEDEPELDFFLFPASMDVNLVRGADTVLVVEISDSSLEKDRFVKGPIYARHGVPVYGVVDAVSRVTLVHHLVEAAYGEPVATSFDAPLIVPGVPMPLLLADLV